VCNGARACRYPGLETACGLCTACDGLGACGAKPADDSACGTIACSHLTTACRTYTDLATNRCVAVGQCEPVDTLHCTAYTNATDGTECTCGAAAGGCVGGACVCGSDGGVDAAASDGPTADAAPADAAAEDAAIVLDAATGPDAGGDAGTTPVCPKPSSSCGCAGAPGGGASLFALAALVALLARRRRCPPRRG
jgi:MYXO-CTERM domain-containing protein